MSSDSKKIKARDEFRYFAEQYYSLDFEKIAAPKLSIALARFYVQEIYNRTQSEISDDDLDSAIVDGKGDLTVDFLHKEDNRVLIIQSKYKRRGAMEDFGDIAKFQQVLETISNQALKGNKRLEDKLDDLDLANDEFTLVYASLGQFTPEMLRRAEETRPNYPTKYSELEGRCSWEYLDEQKLDEEYRNALLYTQGASERSVDLYPKGDKGERGKSVIEVQSGDYKSYILALDAPQIVAAYNHLGKDAIFNLNIRGYIGKNSKNQAIQKTAVDYPEQFFLYNNGISCLCTKLEMEDKKVVVKGLQVINGAQTVRSLVQASRPKRGGPSPWAKNAPVILTRITEIPEGYSHGGKLREEITKSNNTQNIIRDADFRSNDPIQKHLASQFGELMRDKRKVIYVSKRTAERPDPKKFEVVKIKEFAKIVYPFLHDAISYSESESFLFDDSESGGYNKVFGDGQTVDGKMPTDEFRLRAAIYWIGFTIGVQLKNDHAAESDPDVRPVLERKWAFIYGARCALQLYFDDDDWKTQVRRLYKGDWKFGEDSRGKWVQSLYNMSKAGVLMAYDNERKSNPKFSHRGWLRSGETPQAIRRTLRNLKSLFSVDKLP